MMKPKIKKIIEIDDAGWGDLIGGVFITVMRMDTYQQITGEIPLQFFQGDLFGMQAYLNECTKVIWNAITNLGVNREEFEIHMCQGFVFTNAHEHLQEMGWMVKRRRISGTVQYMVENAYREAVEALGFNYNLPIEQRMYERKRRDGSKELISRGKFRFFRFIDWLKEDPENRIQYVKTGFRSWSYWKYNVMSHAELRKKYKEMKNQD